MDIYYTGGNVVWIWGANCLFFFFRDVIYKYLVPSFVNRVVKFGSYGVR